MSLPHWVSVLPRNLSCTLAGRTCGFDGHQIPSCWRMTSHIHCTCSFRFLGLTNSIISTDHHDDIIVRPPGGLRPRRARRVRLHNRLWIWISMLCTLLLLRPLTGVYMYSQLYSILFKRDPKKFLMLQVLNYFWLHFVRFRCESVVEFSSRWS